jgi:predicted ATPase
MCTTLVAANQSRKALLCRAFCKIVNGEVKLRRLLLTTRRPEYVPPWLDWAVIIKLRLEPLPMRLGVDILRETLTRQVVDKADGNPLFAEEIVS